METFPALYGPLYVHSDAYHGIIIMLVLHSLGEGLDNYIYPLDLLLNYINVWGQCQPILWRKSQKNFQIWCFIIKSYEYRKYFRNIVLSPLQPAEVFWSSFLISLLLLLICWAEQLSLQIISDIIIHNIINKNSKKEKYKYCA